MLTKIVIQNLNGPCMIYPNANNLDTWLALNLLETLNINNLFYISAKFYAQHKNDLREIQNLCLIMKTKMEYWDKLGAQYNDDGCRYYANMYAKEWITLQEILQDW